MFNGITFDPPIPISAILGMGGVIAALVVLGYSRVVGRGGSLSRASLAVVRLMAVAGIVTVLMRPMRIEQADEPGDRPVFTVIVDASTSMKTEDCDGAPRYESVAKTLRDAEPMLGELGRLYDIQFFSFAKELAAASYEGITLPLKPDGTTTDIGASLMQAANLAPGRRRAGMLLISDGRENGSGTVQQATNFLKSRKVPVWTVPVGTEYEAKDVYVSARLAQNFAFVKQPATIRVSITQTGFQDWYAKVHLYRDKELAATQQVMLKGTTANVSFPIKEDARGVYRYRVEVETMPGESDETNNGRTLFVRAVDEKSRILFVESQPYWDSKFLLRALQADPNIQVTAVFMINAEKAFTVAEKATDDPLRKASVTQGVRIPTTKEELYQYDCVMLGKDVDFMFTAEQLKLFRDYVSERGGSLVFARGRASNVEQEALDALSPVLLAGESSPGGRFELTAEGRTNPVFSFGHATTPDIIIRELPEMVSITNVAKEKSLSIVLARGGDPASGEKMAAIAYQRIGQGKVMTLGTSGLWRWAFMPQDYSEFDDIYERFWAQMIRWLIYESDFLPGQDVSFRTNQYAYSRGEDVMFSCRTQFVSNEEFEPEVVLRDPKGEEVLIALSPQEDDPTNYSASYLPESEGEYEAILRSKVGKAREQQSNFTVYADSIEDRFVAADEGLMRTIASVTGGEALALSEIGRLPEKIREFERATRSEVEPLDAWDTLTIFSILVAFLAVEWLARRRVGLV